mmetsp:Transcript_41474/g.39900  ORF Transcript_41474/g.39900 Transcript_41474/m.39900 type:complete len:94 (-) Transcript_41474:6-287(-)
MERINPPEINQYMVRNGELYQYESLSELGIFSLILIDPAQNDPLEYNTVGKLIRTKGKQSNEGGVNAGYAFVDTPFLVEGQDLNNIKPFIETL